MEQVKICPHLLSCYLARTLLERNQLNNMKGFLSHSVVCVAMLFMGLLAATGMMAQGKTGTTIVFDATTSHGLFASGADGADINKQYFGLVRHDISHVQILFTNEKNGELNDTGTGVFKL